MLATARTACASMFLLARSAADMSVIGLAGDVIARTSKPPPKVSALFDAAMNELGVVIPTTSVNTTNVNIASVMPVRSRFRSG